MDEIASLEVQHEVTSNKCFTPIFPIFEYLLPPVSAGSLRRASIHANKDIENTIMALLPSFNNLPKYLTDAWRIDHDPYINDFYHSEEELRYWSIERLMTLFLHSSELSTVVTNGASPHLDSNGEDDDLTRRWLVESGEHSYPALREFLRLRGIEEDNMDIDGAILNGEIHIRARGLANADRKFLVCLPQLLEILRPRAVHILPEIIQYTRNPSVKAAVTVLDSWRSVRFSLHISNESFAATFARITKNILKDLDWRNVVVAGGMVLTTLLHVDSGAYIWKLVPPVWHGEGVGNMLREQEKDFFTSRALSYNSISSLNKQC